MVRFLRSYGKVLKLICRLILKQGLCKFWKVTRSFFKIDMQIKSKTGILRFLKSTRSFWKIILWVLLILWKFWKLKTNFLRPVKLKFWKNVEKCFAPQTNWLMLPLLVRLDNSQLYKTCETKTKSTKHKGTSCEYEVNLEIEHCVYLAIHMALQSIIPYNSLSSSIVQLPTL